jgi:hypothetical protein
MARPKGKGKLKIKKVGSGSQLTATAAELKAENQSTLNMGQIAQAAAADMRRVEEYHYRRGLVVAMECILRELR